MTDWANIRANKISNERPDDWDKGIRAISINGLGLFGVHESTNEIYWDGKKIVTHSKVRLGKLELWLVGIAAVGTFGTFLLELWRALMIG